MLKYVLITAHGYPEGICQARILDETETHLRVLYFDRYTDPIRGWDISKARDHWIEKYSKRIHGEVFER